MKADLGDFQCPASLIFRLGGYFREVVGKEDQSEFNLNFFFAFEQKPSESFILFDLPEDGLNLTAPAFPPLYSFLAGQEAMRFGTVLVESVIDLDLSVAWSFEAFLTKGAAFTL